MVGHYSPCEGSPVILRKLTSYINTQRPSTLLLAVLLGPGDALGPAQFLTEYYLPGVIWILYIFLFLFRLQTYRTLVGNTFIISTGHARTQYDSTLSSSGY